MEPQDNAKITLRKAISAHEEAEATLVDLMRIAPDPRFDELLARVKRNLADLHAADAHTGP